MRLDYWRQDMDGPLSFFEMGMARTIPKWVPLLMDGEILHLGPGRKTISGTRELEWPEFEFDEPLCLDRIPSGSCGGAIASKLLEHLADPRHLIREVGRVLKEGAPFNIIVPHGQSGLFIQDLDHKSAFNLETWKTLLNDDYYTKDKEGFPFRVGFNAIMGITELNIGVVTQLIKESPE